MIDVVCKDNNTKIVRLVVPTKVDGVDLSDLIWTINVENADKATDSHTPSSVAIKEGKILIDWTIHGIATSVPGITSYQYMGVSESGMVWQNAKMYLNVRDRIEATPSEDEEDTLTDLQKLIVYVDAELKNIIEAGEAAMDAAQHPPIIGENNNWFVYDYKTKQYVDTGKPSRGSGGSGSGEDGGYYTPTLSDGGELTWEASKEDMPEVPSVNIRGPKGEDGKDGANGKDGVDGQDGSSGVYIGEQEPTDPNVNVWIKPDGEAIEIPEPYTLPVASADTLGGVKVGEGLQMDGDMLSVVPEGEYELIETITPEEDMVIERTVEPDGTPYDFDVVALRIKKPAGITIDASMGISANTKKKTTHALYFMTTTKTEEQWAYAIVEKHRGKWLRRRSPNWDVYNSTLYPYEVIYPMFDSSAQDDTINKIYSTKTIPAGLVVEIWGVRA